MTNITLKIDSDILEKARRLAVVRKTSINAIVQRRLEDFVAGELNREGVLSGLESFFQRNISCVGKRTWTRDEIHARDEIHER